MSVNLQLTEAERWRLRNPRAATFRDQPAGVPPVSCHHCGYTWEYGGNARRATCPVCQLKTPANEAPVREDGRGLTTPMCSAIREAARDGLTYRETAALFSFVNDPTGVWRHATGRCSHDGAGVPPEPPARDPGPVNRVDAEECRDLRTRYADGETVTELADATGRSQSTVYRHTSDGCSHGGEGA